MGGFDAQPAYTYVNWIAMLFSAGLGIGLLFYGVAEPIGNLNDFSLRSINTLNEVDRIYAEDTRVASKLLQNFKIAKKSIAFHEHNEELLIFEIIEFIALVMESPAFPNEIVWMLEYFLILNIFPSILISFGVT